MSTTLHKDQGVIEDWEEWEDESVVTPIDDDEQVLVQHPLPPKPPSQHLRLPKNPAVRASRHSTVKISRLKSRRRQKAQNAKAGIRLITDMTALGRNNQAVDQTKQPNAKEAKFVDSAALRALEGEPSSPSVGSWNWLRKHKEKSRAATSPQDGGSPDHDLSPDDRPIMIGIAVPPSDVSSLEPNPDSTNPAQNHRPLAGHTVANDGLGIDHEPKSFWSPDTPDTVMSFAQIRTSSIYSQAPPPNLQMLKDAPAVPSVPKQYKQRSGAISQEPQADGDNDETDTPCTLFEEDATSAENTTTSKKPTLLPESAGSPSRGWWDHVVTPFADKRMTFSSRKQKLDSPIQVHSETQLPGEYIQRSSIAKAPIIRIPTPRRSPSPGSSAGPTHTSASRVAPPVSESLHNRKHGAIVMDDESVMDQPPPYSSLKRSENGPIRYRAVFPPGHPLQSQFPPSPNPVSPGLAANMTSQGATHLTNMEPASVRGAAHLPARPAGTYVPPEHLLPARGPQNRVERTRRRHEKEDMVARRVGGLWRGRACFPAAGCCGRTGREGRKKRRVWLGICTATITVLILIIVLAVVLTRPHGTHDVPSIWVNLTDFPPMPTGVLTVVGGDNTAARSVCTEPTTLWSCSLPKDDQQSVAPYKPNQPTVIMQIEWDNSTNNSWKVPNGIPPDSVSRRALGLVSRSRLLRRAATEFQPNPPAPDFKEMWFLGEATDGIVSDQKAGEPAPFYISILKSMNDTVEAPNLRKRDDSGNTNVSHLLPHPDLAADGTPVPAVMLPKPVQQPVRLYDRGLDTEHYGFYTYFKRTMFVRSVTVLNSSDESNIPLDEDGGCRKTEARFMTTWTETRMLVRIWTRKFATNTSSLLRPGSSSGIGGVAQLRRPGTMPWPVTITLDTHGGDPKNKVAFETPMDDRLRLLTQQSRLLVNDMSVGGTWINNRGTGDPKYGGFDGGTGGCTCEWVNWIQRVQA